MSNATGPTTTGIRDGTLIPMALAAVKVYRGAAAGFVAGTGYATPLVATSPTTNQFAGIFEETYDNTAGAAGGYFTTVRRKGVACFGVNGTAITAANLGAKVYFYDDHTVTLTPGTIGAGVVAAVDAAGNVWVDIDCAMLGILASHA